LRMRPCYRVEKGSGGLSGEIKIDVRDKGGFSLVKVKE